MRRHSRNKKRVVAKNYSENNEFFYKALRRRKGRMGIQKTCFGQDLQDLPDVVIDDWEMIRFLD